MTEPRPIIVRSKPGVQRDGTRLDSEAYVDALWTRFDRDKPRKIRGYRAVTSDLPEIVYGMHSFSQNALQYLHLGSQSLLTQVIVNNSGGFTGLNDRTPVGFTADANNLWQFDVLPNAVAQTSSIIAHAAPNLGDIASSTLRPIYYNADASVAGALIDTTLDPVSGGVVVVGPYVFSYGNAGFISYTVPNDPTTPDFTARVTGQKVIQGYSLRGAGSGPSALFWSLDALLRATFTGGTPTFAFDTLSEISVLSSRSIIEYDGIYYWWGTGRAVMFNGVVQEVPNQFNIDWFLDDFDFTLQQQVFAIKIPRFGEIWWIFPKNGLYYAVIYNVRSRIWYDTLLPNLGRTSGQSPRVFPFPFMTDRDLTSTGYTLWQHESGTDAVKGTSVEPIPAFFETSDFSMLESDEPSNKSLRVARIEPDFVQSGDMSVVAVGNANSRAPTVDETPVTFVENATTPAEETVMLKTSRRQLRFRFISNTPNGNFFMGKTVAHLEPVDGRVAS